MGRILGLQPDRLSSQTDAGKEDERNAALGAAGIVGGPVERDQPLAEAGLDSIGAVELRNAISQKVGVDLPATVTFDNPTVTALARYVLGHAHMKDFETAIGPPADVEAIKQARETNA